MAARALLPHEIVEQALQSEGNDKVAELEWVRMVEDMTKEGKLSDSLAVCDVSDSMKGLPMQVCIALGLLISEMSSPPWKGHVISISANPKLHLVEGDTLAEKYRFTQNMEWSRKTNFQKVFDVILNVACECKLQPEKMIKQLFVFSDMLFHQVLLNPLETDYWAIERKYKEAGYGTPPRVVFWNLREWYYGPPWMWKTEGIAMVSGYSENLLKVFLNNGEINQMLVVKQAIQGELFEQLVVLD
ncbi:uncharacterized protein LOC131858909 [Cryptomeria japonica]|uniref:uncharacterized protein LOC131858909 n=1 Tax=Cryptomeria japonica TaxID=3369 RepID=UPI0027D9F3C5|nr:uncharacterized protein LOC131858909 [Cryptomeria japonica]